MTETMTAKQQTRDNEASIVTGATREAFYRRFGFFEDQKGLPWFGCKGQSIEAPFPTITKFREYVQESVEDELKSEGIEGHCLIPGNEKDPFSLRVVIRVKRIPKGRKDLVALEECIDRAEKAKKIALETVRYQSLMIRMETL